MWLQQYLLGGFVASFVGLYIYIKRSKGNKTWALDAFFSFGLLIAIWEFSSFFQRTASTPEISGFFFYIVLISSAISQPAYLITALSIQKEKRYLFLIFVPALIRIISFLFLDIDFFMGSFGWNYDLSLSGITLEIGTVIYLGYLLAIIVILIGLVRNARSSVLRKKYLVLLVSFTLFQAIGFSVTNYILAVDHNFPPLGGVLQFMTFIGIGYALNLKESKIPSLIHELTSFPEVYSSFLTDFYNLTAGARFGEASFKFTEFLKNALIEDKTSVKEDEISFEATDSFDVSSLVNRDLKFLEREGNHELNDYYLRVLNAAQLKLGTEFNKVVMSNLDFLKESDLIYGISGGDYLKFIAEDNSLDGLIDVDACLRIYKRLLLPLLVQISSHDFQKRIALYQTTKALKTTKYGEISVEETRGMILQFPKDQQLSAIIESFNPLVSWAYENVLHNTNLDNSTVLENLELVLGLNREKAIQLRIYPTLLERLAAKIPKEEIEQLYHQYLEEVIKEKSGELQQVRSRLLEAERLSAIGRTTAMVGHDLRNPLQVIINTLYLARMKLELIPPQLDKDEIEEIYNKIESQALYMDKIVTDLQDFSRPIAVNPIKAKIKDLIDETISSLSVPDNVTVSLNLNNAPMLRFDQPSMKRVFYNLILNAFQAMPDGGTLTITANATDEEVIITVVDTGKGIPKEIRSRIFEPFFTTKAQGQGLGLSICKKFVEANGGSIEVESKEGKSTTFKITLPII